MRKVKLYMVGVVTIPVIPYTDPIAPTQKFKYFKNKAKLCLKKSLLVIGES